MRAYRDYVVWQRAHALVLSIYEAANRFPPEERFGVTAQLRRAALSVPTNIAEGSKRRTDRDFARFVNIAEGSLAEADYLLLCARDLRYLPAPEHRSLAREIDELSRMLFRLRQRLECDPRGPRLTADS